MGLRDVLADPARLAILRQRSAGDVGIPLIPMQPLPPMSARWPQRQVRNTGAATQARLQSTRGVGEKGGR